MPLTSPTIKGKDQPRTSDPPALSLRERKIDLPHEQVKVLLLENCHADGAKLLRDQGFQVESLPKTVEIEDLKKKVKDVHVLGVRSKTKLTKEVLDCAENLLAIGCFCIGTDQTDLTAAEMKGVPVFNAPFCSSRSVAELAMAEMVILARQIGDRSKEMHEGIWNKVSKNCYEVRGKTLGIVGYGHVGASLSVLAESYGMRVVYYDIDPQMALGNANPLDTLDELFEEADFISLHVPFTPQTDKMIGKEEFAKMKKGAYFLNLARGKVIDVDALAEALKSGHIAGAAVDVYPWEPAANGPDFETPLRGCPNTLLSPHIGGSTEEAQAAIGMEVATKLVKYIMYGGTVGAVNFPQLELPSTNKGTRILNVHANKPGVVKAINDVLYNSDANINAQVLATTDNIGYFICKVEDIELGVKIRDEIEKMPHNIHTRLF